MLSRVACNIYWAARYLERAEDTARLINVHSHLLLDLPRRNLAIGWEPVLAITGSEELFAEHYRSVTEANVVKLLLSDQNNSSSIISSLRLARENFRSTRDIIPREGWEELNDLYLSVQQRISDGISRRNRYDALKGIIRHCQLITGLFHGAMSHDEAFHFLMLGRHLERADMTSRILDVRSASLLSAALEVELTPLENIQWMSVLKSLTGYQMYRRHVRLQVRGANVLDFILRDSQFPRSIYFCLLTISNSLRTLPNYHRTLRRLNRSKRALESADVATLATAGLQEFIDDLQLDLAMVHNSINETYFSVKPELINSENSQSQMSAP